MGPINSKATPGSPQKWNPPSRTLTIHSELLITSEVQSQARQNTAQKPLVDKLHL